MLCSDFLVSREDKKRNCVYVQSQTQKKLYIYNLKHLIKIIKKHIIIKKNVLTRHLELFIVELNYTSCSTFLPVFPEQFIFLSTTYQVCKILNKVVYVLDLFSWQIIIISFELKWISVQVVFLIQINHS